MQGGQHAIKTQAEKRPAADSAGGRGSPGARDSVKRAVWALDDGDYPGGCYWLATIGTFGRIAAANWLPMKGRCLTPTVTKNVGNSGGNVAKTLTGQARRELIDAVRARYRISTRSEKRLILKEFSAITGYHRKSAIRVLNQVIGAEDVAPRAARPRVYDEAFQRTLLVLWEASDRVCGKRLRALLPALVSALERHGHLVIDPETRAKLMAVSAASIDRLLQKARGLSSRRAARRAPTALRRSVPIRTYADWNAPPPGFLEIDLVAHCGEVVAGAYVNTLTLTDIASGWTECVPLVVRDSALVIEAIEHLQPALPFAVRGLDIDNGSEFLNEALAGYCKGHGIELTRSRPYRKNDQAWVEQKNGSVVRRLVGYRRLEGSSAAAILARLYAASRLFVNFFQPSFKLKEKLRVGGRTVKRYEAPQTPCARLLALDSTPVSMRAMLEEALRTLDPLRLLEEIRTTQHQLVCLADGGEASLPATQREDLQRFLMGLATAWQSGEVRPTHLERQRKPHDWRTRKDPFEAVWPKLLTWFDEKPDQTAKMLFARLQGEHPGEFEDGQVRTLQRRLRQWRLERANKLVFGMHHGTVAAGLEALSHALISERSPTDLTQADGPGQSTAKAAGDAPGN
jgi:hypothetical protein